MRKRILLVNPVARSWALPNCFPTGLGYIAAVLDWAGHDVRVLDLNATRDGNLQDVLFFNPDVIGLTGIITQYGEVKRLASALKALAPEVPIICGGPLATSIPDLLLKLTGVDFCVLGEGENTIRDMMGPKGLFNAWGIKAKLPDGTVCHSLPQPIIQDLETIPHPAYDLFPTEVYLNNPIAADNVGKWVDGRWSVERKVRKSINMIGTRGCAFDCIFCAHCYIGQGYRTRAPSDIVREMKMLGQRYGVKYIHFTDDSFATIPRFVTTFCHAIQERRVMSDFLWDITWSCAGRANIVTDDLIEMMADAGCEGLCYGLESGSQRMLDVMNKKVTVEQYRKAIALNKKHFKYEDYTFIVGTPGETWDTVKESVAFCKDEGIVPTAVFYMTPYPGTPLFNDLLKTSPAFAAMVESEKSFEQFILSLGEQGEQMVWNCTDSSDEEVEAWHQYFLEETGAWNRMTHSK